MNISRARLAIQHRIYEAFFLSSNHTHTLCRPSCWARCGRNRGPGGRLCKVKPRMIVSSTQIRSQRTFLRALLLQCLPIRLGIPKAGEKEGKEFAVSPGSVALRIESNRLDVPIRWDCRLAMHSGKHLVCWWGLLSETR